MDFHAEFVDGPYIVGYFWLLLAEIAEIVFSYEDLRHLLHFFGRSVWNCASGQKVTIGTSFGSEAGIEVFGHKRHSRTPN